MSEGKCSSGLPAVLLLVALAGGVVIGLWMTTYKAHEYYHADDPGRLYLPIREQDSTFKVERAGRYELSYRDDLGDLTFDVVSIDRGTPIPLERFGIVTQMAHTRGWRGHAFWIDSPGIYRLSIRPWANGAEVHLSDTNTQAIARWSFGGMLFTAVCPLMTLIIFRIFRRAKESGSRPTEVPKASPG
jgi:hypothetical protein